MKVHYSNRYTNKYPKKEQHCFRCDKLQDKIDLKLGCARCEWEATGTDVPTSRKHLYESRDNRGY